MAPHGSVQVLLPMLAMEQSAYRKSTAKAHTASAISTTEGTPPILSALVGMLENEPQTEAIS